MITPGQARAELARRELARRGVPLQQPPSMLQKTAQTAMMPFRGYRGMAVGLENLMAHPTQPAAALSRAADATQTGFQPKGFGETAASMVGESVPLMPLGGALSSGGKIAQLLKAASLSGGLSALTQTAEEGKPTVGRTSAAAALGAAPVAAMQGLKGAFPYVAAKFTKTVPAAYENLTTSFKNKFPGTAQYIEEASGKVFPALKKAFGDVNKRLEGRKEFMGMGMAPKEAMSEAEATGGEPRTISRIVKEFKDIQKRSAPISERKVPSQLVGPRGEPLMKTEIVRGIPKGEKLRRLSDMSIDINKQTEGSYTTDVFQTKKGIEREAEKTGGTSFKIFQKFKQQWGKLKDIEDRMGTNLNDPHTAGAEFERVVRRDIEGKASPTDIGKLEAIRDLERTTGKQIIEPLKKQIISSYTNTALSDFVPKGMLGKLLLMKYWPEGLASFALGSPKAMGGVAQALYNPSGPVSQSARSLMPSVVSRTLNQFRGGDNQQ